MSADEARALREAATEGPWATYDLMGPRATSGVCTAALSADVRPLVIARGMTAADARLCEVAPDLARTVVALHAEVARLREIVEGRTTPPTRSEMDAIRASGGAVRFQIVRASGGTLRGHVYDHDEVLQFERFDGVRWWAHDATGRPCAWPVVGGAR